jgi:formate hydrogenlyase subunit 3/multisubunit Na+/H+ antiporter MnhD subunit
MFPTFFHESVTYLSYNVMVHQQKTDSRLRIGKKYPIINTDS